jgi:endonuclease/exonuclease/phosphatase (EEP) superfamily protein YafD
MSMRRLTTLASVGAIVFLLLGFAQSLHPFFDSFSHFRLHVAVLLAAGLIAVIALRSWALAAAGGLTLAAAIAMMAPTFVAAPVVTEPDLKLIQFNLLFGNKTPGAVAAEVARFQPDVITFQELSERNAAILKILKPDYPYQLHCSFDDIALLSRHPPLTQRCLRKQKLAWMRIAVRGREVSVASLHLRWPWPSRQAVQIKEILPVIAGMPQPVVIAGDFNAAPWSHAVQYIAAASRTAVAPGLRLTFEATPSSTLRWPVLPIDHVLAPVGGAAEVRIGERAGSDHLPLMAAIKLPPE